MTQIFALAFDHRNSLRRGFMHLAGPPTPEQHATMVAAKEIVTDALIAAAPRVSPGSAVLLIDHEYGGRFVPGAQAAGLRVAMPVEESGRAELRYLCDGHPDRVVDAYRPDYVKVLIRYNPGGDAAMNARQRARLRELSNWLQGRPQQLMLELLVPPEDAQLAAVANDRGRFDRGRFDGERFDRGRFDRGRFDREARAELTAVAIRQIAADGIRPALWKIEGPESRADAARIAAAVRSADPGAGCLVLGRGADAAAVRRWLAIAAATAGFNGFAVGRTIWWDALRDFANGGGGDRDTAVRAVAARYLDLVRDYQAVRAAT
jgi:myo-inositol catabolism protein IolC